MKLRHIYKVSVEDAPRLSTIVQFKVSRWAAWTLLLLVVGGVAAIGFIVGRASAWQKMAVGEERLSVIDAMLSLDSLREVVGQNDAYLRNVAAVLNPSRNPAHDSLSVAASTAAYSVDNLMERSDAEKAFATRISEREKYNVSVLAPLQAEDIEFFSLCPQGVQTASSMGHEIAEYLVPVNATVNAPTEGRVVDLYYSPAEGGNVLIVQQPRGFLLRLGSLGTLLVQRGDNLQGGEAIAFGNAVSGRRKGRITAEMWHNGSRIVPGNYLNVRKPASRYKESDNSEEK